MRSMERSVTARTAAVLVFSLPLSLGVTPSWRRGLYNNQNESARGRSGRARDCGE